MSPTWTNRAPTRLLARTLIRSQEAIAWRNADQRAVRVNSIMYRQALAGLAHPRGWDVQPYDVTDAEAKAVSCRQVADPVPPSRGWM